MLHFPWTTSSVWTAVLVEVQSNMLIFHLLKKVPQGWKFYLDLAVLACAVLHGTEVTGCGLSQYKDLPCLKLQGASSILWLFTSLLPWLKTKCTST